MNHAINVLKEAIMDKNSDGLGKMSKGKKPDIESKIISDLTAALSLLSSASEWWACPGADIITKEPPDKEDCQTCVKRSCPGPVKYLIAKGGE